MVEKISNGVDDVNMTAMISKCNMEGNPKEWWIDTGELVTSVQTDRCFHPTRPWGVMKNLYG